MLREALAIPAGEVVAFGMSLGFADEAAPLDALRTERAPLAELAAFSGF